LVIVIVNGNQNRGKFDVWTSHLDRRCRTPIAYLQYDLFDAFSSLLLEPLKKASEVAIPCFFRTKESFIQSKEKSKEKSVKNKRNNIINVLSQRDKT